MSKLLSIIIVVSDPAVRDALHFYLTASGFTAYPWQDCRTPPSSNHVVDSRCVILDHRLPTLDGTDVVEGLRREGNHVPAILLVEGITKELERRAAGIGACKLLELPLLGTILREAIDEIAV